MKKLILDTPFRDSFEDFLEKGEKIVWRGASEKGGNSVVPVEIEKPNPTAQMLLSVLVFIYFSGLLYFDFIYEKEITFWVMVLVRSVLTFIYVLWNHLFSKPSEYAITNRRVFFKSHHNRKEKIFEIPFLEIINCVVVENENEDGTIFLGVRNPAAIPFDTFAVGKSEREKRTQPTLENIEAPQQVAQLIRERIRKNKTLQL